MVGSPRAGPTQGTGSPSVPDGGGDRAAALRARPLLRSRAHTKKGPEERSLRLRRFLVQVRRMQTQARPSDGGSGRAPSPLPAPGRVLTCFPAPPLLLVGPRGRVGALQQPEAGLRGDSAPSLNVAPVLVDVDAAAATAATAAPRHRQRAQRGGAAPKSKAPSFSERSSGLSGRARALGGPASAPGSPFGSFRRGRSETGKLWERSALSGGRKGGKKGRERWGNAVNHERLGS